MSRPHGSGFSHPTAPVQDRLVAGAAGRADRLVLAGLSRLFLGQPVAMDPDAHARVLERLVRYRLDPGLGPDHWMPAPERSPTLVIHERRESFGPSGGLIAEHGSFRTPYRPLDPDHAAEYAGYPELDTVHVHALRHVRPARATLLLTHGWGVGHWWMHRIEFAVRFLVERLGLDVYFYVAPYHAGRTPAVARFSGQLHPSPNLVRTNEAFIQTGMEVRALISAILARNAAPLGMMGSSLGGYTSALVASIDDRLDFVVPVMPPASMAHLLWDHGGDVAMRARAQALGFTRDLFHSAWALHSPLSWTPKVPWSRRMIVTALGDTLVTPAHTAPLWEHWGRPRHFRFPGGHTWQVRSRLYHRELGRFLRRLGLVG